MTAPMTTKAKSCKRVMLIECDQHQSRVAILEDDRPAEIYLERQERRTIVGNIYKGKVSRVLPGMQAAFVDVGLDRNAFLFVGEVIDPQASYDDLVRERAPTIGELLAPGQELVLQVLKDPLRDKGARVTTELTLPGRYLVLLPKSHQQAGVSRRIEEPEERERLRTLAEGLRPEQAGLIIRTAGEGRNREDLETDLAFLVSRWRCIEARIREAKPASLVHRDLDLAERVVRDVLDTSVDVVRVDGTVTHQRIKRFVEDMEPALADRILLDDYAAGLFARFGIDRAMDDALKERVWLKCGGSIVINQTEALVAIDVNTSRFVGRTNLEETVLATNLEAVVEIARQIRLRNLGGIIVLDLIDMESPENRASVLAELTAELAKDRARTKLLGISDFGLVQLTRKRSRPSLERQLTESCPHCRGTGRVRSAPTVCLDLRRALLESAARWPGQDLTVRLHPEVAARLERGERQVLEEVEAVLGAAILLTPEPHRRLDQYEILEPEGVPLQGTPPGTPSRTAPRTAPRTAIGTPASSQSPPRDESPTS